MTSTETRIFDTIKSILDKSSVVLVMANCFIVWFKDNLYSSTTYDDFDKMLYEPNNIFEWCERYGLKTIEHLRGTTEEEILLKMQICGY